MPFKHRNWTLFPGRNWISCLLFPLPTFDVNLFRLNSAFTLPHFDGKHIPFPARRQSAEGERQTAQVLASSFIYCIAIIIFTLSNTGHIKITKCPIIVTEKQSKAKELSTVILIELVGWAIDARVASPGHNFGNHNNLLAFTSSPQLCWWLLNFNQNFFS